MAKAKEEKQEEESAKDNMFTCGKDENCMHYKHKCKKVKCGGGTGGGAIYGFGLIGALVYFFMHLGQATFGNVIVAIIKSIAWPALFVYRILQVWGF